MSRNGNSDDTPESHRKNTSPESGSDEMSTGPSRPPARTLLLWLLILFAPVTILLFSEGRNTNVDELTASEFEQFLQNGRVHEAVLQREPGAGVMSITGKYRPAAGSAEVAEEGASAEKEYTVRVVYSDALDEMLRAHCQGVRDVENNSNIIGHILVSLLPILLLVALIYFLFSRQLKAAGKGALQFGKSRARLHSANQPKVTFEDVAGIDEAKDEMEEIIEYLKDPDKFQRLGGRIPKGVLMIGPPGTGKTLLAKAIAGEADVPFFSISGSDFVEMFVGVGASRVRDMFEDGKRHSPCLIFIDEIDAVGRSRFTGIGGGHDEREQTLNALLVEMDGFDFNTGVLVIAATNRPDVLDPALLRPGRFDRQIAIDLPDLNGRIGILKLHARKVKIADGVSLETIARGTAGFSGADLANLINEAALFAARNGKSAIELSDLEEARDKVRWGKERRSRKISEEDRRITAYHEAGHALVGILCEKATPLHKVTIIPRGVAYLGATMNLPEKDRYTQSRTEVLDQIAVLMGGRTAESLVVGEISSGAAMDIQQATNIARKMVCKWGMSEKLGPLSYDGSEEQVFLGRDITRKENHSEETARLIDSEVRAIIESAHQRVTDLLTENLERLKMLGETLLEQETLGAEEVYELLDVEKPDTFQFDDDAAESAGQEDGDEGDDDTSVSGEEESESLQEPEGDQ